MFVVSSETGVSRCDRQHPEGFRGGDRQQIIYQVLHPLAKCFVSVKEGRAFGIALHGRAM